MQRKEGSLTEKRYRNIREFVKNDWPEFKKQIRVIQTEPEKEYLQRIKEAAKVAMC
jgi:3-dehydroquinate dehydratase